MQGAAEVVVQPHHAVAAEDLDAPGGAPAQDVVPDAGQLGLEPRGERQRHGGQVLDAFVAGVVGGAGREAIDLAEAEAQDVEVVDGVLDEAAAAGLGHVRRATATRTCPGSGSTGRRGRRAAIGSPRVPPSTRSRSARNTGALRRTSPHWLGTPAALDRVDQRGGAGEVAVERLLAEDGAAGGEGRVHGIAVRRRRRAHPDGVGPGGDLFGPVDGDRPGRADGLDDTDFDQPPDQHGCRLQR